MFCPKCGKQLKDTVKFCSGCGSNLYELRKLAKQAEQPQKPAEPTRENPKTKSVPAKTVKRDFTPKPDAPENKFPNVQPNNNFTPEKPEPQVYPDSSIKWQQPPQKPQSEPSRSEYQDSFTVFKNEYPAEREFTPPPQKKRKLLVPIIIAAAVLVLAGAGGVLWYMNSNSDTNTIEHVVDQILDDDLEDAKDTLASFDAENKEAVLDYIKALEKRDKFSSHFNKNLCVDKSPVIVARDEFVTALENFGKQHKISELPEKLGDQYKYYTEKFKAIDELADDIAPDFTKAQEVFMNEVKCNREDTFTLNQIRERIDTSNEALSALNLKLRLQETPAQWADENNSEFTAFRRLFVAFEKATQNEIDFCENEIKNNLAKGFSMSELLSRRSPNTEYKSFVCGDLCEIYEQEHIEENTMIFDSTLRCAFSAYIINNYSD